MFDEVNDWLPPDMAIAESEPPSDAVSFQALREALDLFRIDYPESKFPAPGPSAPTENITNFLLQEKINYLVQLSKKIEEMKENFAGSYETINRKIELMTFQINLYARKRERELKSQLRKMGERKFEVWNRQLQICKQAIETLMGSEGVCRDSGDSSGPILYENLIDQLKFIDGGAIKFEVQYFELFKKLQKMGKIIYQSEVETVENSAQNVRSIAPKFVFGGSGEEEGMFCRPWGVCSDPTGRILVSDRSNHRIQIFTDEGEFLLKFGKYGSGAGEFNRPTGIDVDVNCRVIVADKDNHRIQVFTYSGRYLFSFGRQGTKFREFMYPWDVASNQNCDIAVSDSKNHRVQLFDANGNFLSVFDAKKVGIQAGRRSFEFLDSPRGLAFTPEGELLVTDFNNHRVIRINKAFNKLAAFGSEGKELSRFFRPQGIACNKDGSFAVADCKNYRIQIFDARGTLYSWFGQQGSTPGQFDCPQGICFHENGNVVVVDLNNNRVQVF